MSIKPSTSHLIMVDPTPGTETTKVLPSSGTTPPAETVRPFAHTRSKLVTGGRWQGYQIDAALVGGRPNTFEATHIGRMEKVLISATLISKSTAARRAVWEQLSTSLPPDSRISTCLEAQEEEGWRYEVTNHSSAVTLREWVACHQPEAWTQKHVLEQLSVALSAMHSIGIVHLNVKPESIYLSGDGASMEITLGGLDLAVAYKLVGFAATLNPFYAPPEAFDPEGLQPGVGLCAWDWWSVGRVVQEMILGRHVMSMLFGSDVIHDPTADLIGRAKNLLKEHAPITVRAGAVEVMPGLDSGVEVMLRGLLTSARDARWDGESIRHWLAKESVSIHYHLPRDARFFVWKGRGRSLVDAAQYFRAEENWADGEANLFEQGDSATLANFLSTVPHHAADWQKLQEIHGLVASPDWSINPETARRSLASAIAWLIFGPKPGALVIKGRRIDAAGLTALLANNADASNFEIVKALLSPPCLAQITPLDPSAAETLNQVAAIGGEALRRAEQNRWVDPNDPGSGAYLLKLSLEPEPVLRKRAERVRTAYAACENPELAAILQERNSPPWANLLLVLTGENPRRHGYVTRVERAQQQLVELQERSRQLRTVIFWLRLNSVLLAGRPWSGNWNPFLIFWLGLVVFGVVVARDVTTTTCMAVGLAVLRLLLGKRVQALVHRCDQALALWTWRDGPSRCELEAQNVRADATAAAMPKLEQKLADTEAAMAALRTDGTRQAPTSEISLGGLWPVFGAAALFCIVGTVQLLKNFGQHLGYEALTVAATESERHIDGGAAGSSRSDTPEQLAAMLKELPELSSDMVEKVKRGEYEIVKESFGYALQGPIQKWEFTAPPNVPLLPVKSRAPATASQRAFALVSGELLLRPYGKKGATALLVVRVPNAEGVGLMIYNARSRKLVDNVALTVNEALSDRSWHKVDRFNVIYLGTPTQMDVKLAQTVTQN